MENILGINKIASALNINPLAISDTNHDSLEGTMYGLFKIGEKIKKARKSKGLTQKQLAEASGIHLVSIKKYETNKMKPKVPQIQKISSTLDISFLLLLDFEIIELLESLLEKTDYSFFESDKSILINFRDKKIQMFLENKKVERKDEL